ncbi:MAG: hypothetical protein HZB65_03855 [Candidatus Aenigmarchaeota archaeon]|nr:hypothetical protein [Candidatus Aenigmarchaeota archaeon]
MVLENVSLSLLTWVIVLALVLIVAVSIAFRTTRLRKFKIFPVSELRFLIRFARIASFVLFIVLLMEVIAGAVFGKGLIDTAAVSLTWYVNKASFLGALIIVIFVPRYLFSIVRAKEMMKIEHNLKFDSASSAKAIDSVDWDILSAIKKYGGDLETIKNKLKWIEENDLESRINKLYFLNYLKIDGYDIHLTADALDALNLPAALFASTINDKHIIKKLAEIQIMLKKEDVNGVIVECSKLLETLLKDMFVKKFPDKEKIRSGKPVEAATLGDLIGESREYKLITLFEDNVLTAVNDIRKSVHSKDSKMSSISLEKAYFCHSLTEIAVRSLCSKEG